MTARERADNGHTAENGQTGKKKMGRRRRNGLTRKWADKRMGRRDRRGRQWLGGEPGRHHAEVGEGAEALQLQLLHALLHRIGHDVVVGVNVEARQRVLTAHLHARRGGGTAHLRSEQGAASAVGRARAR